MINPINTGSEHSRPTSSQMNYRQQPQKPPPRSQHAPRGPNVNIYSNNKPQMGINRGFPGRYKMENVLTEDPIQSTKEIGHQDQIEDLDHSSHKIDNQATILCKDPILKILVNNQETFIKKS